MSLKFEIKSLPDVRERSEGELWFKLVLDSKNRWQPGKWCDPMYTVDIQNVESDASLTSFEAKIQKLMQISGRGRFACAQALQNKEWRKSDNQYVIFPTASLVKQRSEPVQVSASFWLYRDRLIKVLGEAPAEDLPLLIKHKVLSNEKALSRIEREVEAFENFETLSRASREPIPEKIRMFVWQRDGGKCVQCGSQQRLEYDHIIALANGGSNTERNIQLLCEACNRIKGTNV